MKQRISKNPEERKQEILKCAKELFLQNGYEKTSIDEIAKKVNIVKGSIYYYFKSKEDIFEAVGCLFIDQLFYFDASILDSDLTASRKLNVIFKILYEYLENQDLKNIDLFIFGNEAVKERIVENTRKKISTVILNIIIQGNLENTFNCKYPHEVAHIITTGILYEIMEMYKARSLKEDYRVFAHKMIYILNLLLSTTELFLDIL